MSLWRRIFSLACVLVLGAKTGTSMAYPVSPGRSSEPNGMKSGFFIAQNSEDVRVDSSGFIVVGKDRIFFEMAGTGPAIVLIHDGLLHRETWDNVFSYFSQNYRMIRYDRRGYGKSTPGSEPYSNVEDLNSLFVRLGLDRACLMGASAGGRCAIDFALKYPEKVNALVLVGAVVNGFPYTEHFNTRGGLMPNFDTSDIDKARDQMSLFFVTKDRWTICPENVAAREKAAGLIKNNHRRGLSPNVEGQSGPPSYKRLGEIKAPTLILVGESDIPDVHAHAGDIQAGITNSKRVIIPKAAHLIPMEQPVLFNKEAEQFLKDLPKN